MHSRCVCIIVPMLLVRKTNNYLSDAQIQNYIVWSILSLRLFIAFTARLFFANYFSQTLPTSRLLVHSSLTSSPARWRPPVGWLPCVTPLPEMTPREKKVAKAWAVRARASHERFRPPLRPPHRLKMHGIMGKLYSQDGNRWRRPLFTLRGCSYNRRRIGTCSRRPAISSDVTGGDGRRPGLVVLRLLLLQ